MYISICMLTFVSINVKGNNSDDSDDTEINEMKIHVSHWYCQRVEKVSSLKNLLQISKETTKSCRQTW